MIKCGFIQSKIDVCLYIKRETSNVCYIIVHVDDMVFASSSEKIVRDTIDILNRKFEVKDLSDIKQFLNIEVRKDSHGSYSLSQAHYIKEIVEMAGLIDGKSQKYPLDPGYHKLEDDAMLDDNSLYRTLIGKLLYVSINTRPDIAASVGILSQRVESPRQADLNEVKRVIRYLKSTIELRLKLSPSPNNPLIAYSDADWAEDRQTRKSISGMICLLYGGAISWTSRKQDLVSISSTESEYYALSETAREVQWLIRLLTDFNVIYDDAIEIHCDSQSCIKMIQNEKFSSRTKHIDVRCHHIKESIRNKEVKLSYCPTSENVADMLTKLLAGPKISFFREMANLRNSLSQGEGN